MLYICQEHDVQEECDVSKSGERICRICEEYVSGVSVTTRGSRAPPSNKPMYQEGNITWIVKSYNSIVRIHAFNYHDALEMGIEKFNNPQNITEVMPEDREYRH